MSASAATDDDDEIAIGSVLDGRYRIDAILGAGGMGRVYRGEHVSLGRQVAIKVLHADLARNKEAAQRFQREAMASGRLEHHNIVSVSDFGIIDGGPCFLVMEVLEGEPLGKLLERNRRLPWQQVITIMKGVLAGLHHAHERGVVHRDIKPDNVFLAEKDGETVVKILDFGIAKLYAGSPDDPAATRAGLTVGTPAYLSPEQAVGGEIKPASDIYSSTILLFELLTGRPPFDEKDPLAMLGAHVSATPPAVKDIAPDLVIPPRLEGIIQHGLVKLQANRLPSAKEYIAQLEAIERAPGADESVVLLTTTVSGHSATEAALAPVPTPLPTPLPLPIAPTEGALGFLSGPTDPRTGQAPVLGPSTLAEIRSSSPVPPDATTPHRPMAIARATHAVALGQDAPGIPRNWIKIGVIVLAAFLLVGLIVAVAGGGDKAPKKAAPPMKGPVLSPPRTETKVDPPPAKADAKPAVAPLPDQTLDPAPAETPDQAPTEKTVEPAAKPPEPAESKALASLVNELEKGKTCAKRKAAIPKLVALGDKAAIAPLKKARYRMYGGILGMGQRNANSCLTAAATSAIKKLGGR